MSDLKRHSFQEARDGCLQGKVVIITGASTGMGRAIAIAMAAEGARLGLVARSASRLGEIAPLAKAKTGRHSDLSGRCGRQGICEARGPGDDRWLRSYRHSGQQCRDQHLSPQPRRYSIADWQRVLDTNLTAAFLFSRYVLPHMREAKKGQIISISSGAALQPSAPAGVAYSASKHALNSLTGSINLEERCHGIRACAIAPGERTPQTWTCAPDLPPRWICKDAAA